jgi:hypothetical protein
MTKRTDKLTERVLERVEALRVQHGAPGTPMKQKTLARRSGQTYARVHKFLSGQMPYPPLDFLNALLMSFGTSLGDVLRDVSSPPRALPIWREDVQRVARMLDEASPAAVEVARGWVQLFLRVQEASGSTDRTTGGLVSETPLVGAGNVRRRAVRTK